MTRFEARLRKLEVGRPNPAACDGGTTMLLVDRGDGPTRAGSNEPFDPATAAPCRKCGRPHVVIVREVIVDAGDEGGTGP